MFFYFSVNNENILMNENLMIKKKIFFFCEKIIIFYL